MGFVIIVEYWRICVYAVWVTWQCGQRG